MFFNGKSPQPENCCGCSACQEICGHGAIKMTTDIDGFIMPEVIEDKCVECGLCEKVCPIRHPQKALAENEGESYAAVNDNKKELLSSSSGGIFSAIANYVLERNGLVYGAAFDDRMQLHHISIDSKGALFRLRGSKYLQSSIGTVYKEIRKELRNGRLVYFTGTGCQVAGLKCFLMKDYENLICSDILCHGTPNQKIFDSVITQLEKKYDGTVIDYKFRDKNIFGWGCSNSTCRIKTKNGLKKINFDSIMTSYYNAFISGCMNREVCYKCPFACERRCGDISLGDFWGVQNYITIRNRRDGVSAILINTPRGKRILNEISNELNLIPARLKDIAVINETLHHPTPRPDYRNTFFNDFKANPAETIMSFQGNIEKARKIYQIKRVAQSNPLFKSIYRFLLNLKK